jgi:hypothetical protein
VPPTRGMTVRSRGDQVPRGVRDWVRFFAASAEGRKRSAARSLVPTSYSRILSVGGSGDPRAPAGRGNWVRFGARRGQLPGPNWLRFAPGAGGGRGPGNHLAGGARRDVSFPNRSGTCPLLLVKMIKEYGRKDGRERSKTYRTDLRPPGPGTFCPGR